MIDMLSLSSGDVSSGDYDWVGVQMQVVGWLVFINILVIIDFVFEEVLSCKWFLINQASRLEIISLQFVIILFIGVGHKNGDLVVLRR